MSTTPTIRESDRPFYPGLRPAEADVLRLWLRRHEAEYDRFEYNVRVGEGRDPGPSYPQDFRDQAILNSQYRIDAIAWKGNQPTIIEVKAPAKPNAIGQILAYSALWSKQNPGTGKPSLLVVTSPITSELQGIFQGAIVPLEILNQQSQTTTA